MEMFYPVKVFVYGTLKQNESNHFVLGNSVFLGEFETINKYTLKLLDFPSLYNTPGEGRKITGELYSVTEDKLKELDRFEGCPSLYYREEIFVSNDGGRINKAFVYFRR